MARAAITFPVLVGLILTTTSTVALGESTNPLPHNGICRRQYLVAATSIDTGTLLYLSTSKPNNFTLEISDRFLPTQCGENYELCDVLLIEMESEVIVFVPSQGGFVMVTYRVGELPHDIFHPVTENCHPVKAFLNSEHNLIVIVCVELSSDTNGSLFIFEFSLSRMTLRCSERFVLHNSRTLSEAVHASNRIFFTENDELLVAESEASSSLEPGFLININNCTRTNQIDVTGNEVSIYCTQNDDSWTVVANSHFSTHHTYSHYPCPGLNQYVRVENKRQIMFGNTTQQPLVGELPDDIAYAACLGSEDSFVFWAFTENGRLVSVPLTTENHTLTNLSECTTEGDNCLRPSFDARKTSGAYFNHETNQVHITNITSLCGHRTVNMFGTPQLLRITLGDKEDSCSCANELPTTLPTSLPTTLPTSLPTTLPSSLPTSLLTTLPSTLPTSLPTSLPTTLPTSLPSSVSLTLSILFSVVGILLIITAIIICVVVIYKCFCNAVRRKNSPSRRNFALLEASTPVLGSERSDNVSDNKSNSSSVDQEQDKLKPSHMQGASTKGTPAGPDVEVSDTQGRSVGPDVEFEAINTPAGPDVDASNRDSVEVSTPVLGSECLDNASDNKSNSSSVDHEQDKLHMPSVKQGTVAQPDNNTQGIPTEAATNSIHPRAAGQTLYINYGVGEEVQAKEMEGTNDTGGDVAGLPSNPHETTTYHSSSVAEKSNEKSRGEDNQNHIADTVRSLITNDR